MAEAIVDLRLEDIPGIQSYQLTKLKRIGIESVLELGVSVPHELAEACGDNIESLSIFVIQA